MNKHINLFATLTIVVAGVCNLHAQGTAFTYQGRLNDGAGPANGTYNLRFALFDALTVGNQVGSPVTNAPVNVSNGLFTVTLDFGANFPGADRWLEIAVRTNGGGAFTSLIPRQPITPAPYAITAGNLSGALPSASLSGTYSSPVTLNNAANNFAGSGANLTALNASQLASGTVPAAALGNAWRIGGNAGTTPGAQFVGTTDNQPLELKVNNQRGLRLEPAASTDTVNVIGGSALNSVGAGVVGATIGGGGAGNYLGGAHTNRVEADFGTVSGGLRNTIQTNAYYSTIGGGVENTIRLNSTYATIGGGSLNLIQDSSFSANIGGGYGNTIQVNTYSATIGGGELNRIESLNHFATLGGGYGNVIQPFAYSATIGGGHGNTTQPSADYATIPGGRENSAANYAFAAGRRAKANHTGAFVWGDSTDVDFASTVANQFAIRASGGVRLSDSTPNLSFGNTARQMLNLFEAPDIFNSSYGIGVQPGVLYFRTRGGILGAASFSWYLSGYHSDTAFDPGGNFLAPAREQMRLDVSGQLTVYGSTGNGVHGISTSAGASAVYGENLSGGGFGVAGRTTGTGMAVYGDNASPSGWAGNFNGSVFVGGNLSFGNTARQMLNLYNADYGIGVQADTLYFRCSASPGVPLAGFRWYRGGTHQDGNGNAGGGTELMSLGSGYLYVNGTFVSSSDRNVKQDFAAVNSRAVLEKVAQLPIQTWAYKNDPRTKHLGPVAQDFYAAFAVGPDDKHITTVDESGVALAAIQGLNQKVEEQRTELRLKETEIAELKQRLEKVEQLLNHNGGTKLNAPGQ